MPGDSGLLTNSFLGPVCITITSPSEHPRRVRSCRQVSSPKFTTNLSLNVPPGPTSAMTGLRSSEAKRSRFSRNFSRFWKPQITERPTDQYFFLTLYWKNKSEDSMCKSNKANTDCKSISINNKYPHANNLIFWLLKPFLSSTQSDRSICQRPWGQNMFNNAKGRYILYLKRE